MPNRNLLGLLGPFVLVLGCGSSTPEPASASATNASADPAASAAPSSAPGSDATASAAASAAPADAPAASATPAADDKKPELSGKLSQTQVKEILEQNGELFNQCYTIGAGKGEQFIAKITVKATVGPKGNVVDAQVLKSNAKNKKVDACVLDAFKKIKFPPPKDAAASVVTFPMEFNGAAEIKK